MGRARRVRAILAESSRTPVWFGNGPAVRAIDLVQFSADGKDRADRIRPLNDRVRARSLTNATFRG